MISFESLGGTVVDEKYRIDRRLGVGGMGAVFVATHIGTGRTVALKLIAPGFASDATFLERFRREARAAGRLRHPNIVDVTDFGVARVGGEPLAYLVMEYLDGCSLDEVLAEERMLPVAWVVDFLDQLALAVDEAHRHGVVHRDLKPSNVWLEPNLRGGFTVKVLDFGLAKVGDDASGAPAVAADASAALARHDASTRPTLVPPASPDSTLAFDASRSAVAADMHDARTALFGNEEARQTAAPPEQLTLVGTIMGTPPYMSPEQCRGEAAGPASDIYSLGVLVYELLAGRLPFEGDSASLIRAHASEAPTPLYERNPAISRRVSDVVMWALEKSPEARPATASDFAAALRAKAEAWPSLFRRAAIFYATHMPLFLRIAVLAGLPYFVVHTLELTNGWFGDAGLAPTVVTVVILIALMALTIVTRFLASVLSKSLAALVVAQVLLAPLRKPRVRVAGTHLVRQLGKIASGAFALSGIVLLPLFASVGFLALGLAIGQSRFGWSVDVDPSLAALRFGDGARGGGIGIVALVAAFALSLSAAGYALKKWIDYQLFPIVLVVEDLGVRAGLARARDLAGRSRREVRAVALAALVPLTAAAAAVAMFHSLLGVEPMSIAGRLLDLTVSAPIMILADPFISVLAALLYLKLRESAGEPIEDVLECQFVDEEAPRSRWQQRLSSGVRSGRRSSASGARRQSGGAG
jgi:serine/threonine protein kinase